MVYADVFPLLPWFGLYLLGTCLGERLADLGATDGVSGGPVLPRLGLGPAAPSG